MDSIIKSYILTILTYLMLAHISRSQAYVLLIGVLFVIFNLVFDIIQGLMDPKLRVGVKDNA